REVGLGQVVVGVGGELLLEQVGEPGEGRVDLDAAPGATAAAAVRPGVQLVQRRRQVTGLHPGQGVAVERQPAVVDERAAEPGAGGEHQHGARAGAADLLRLAHAAHVAVVADDQRYGPAGTLGQRTRVRRVDVEAREALREVGRAVEDPVAAEGAGDRQADAADLVPPQPVLPEVLGGGGDPGSD